MKLELLVAFTLVLAGTATAITVPDQDGLNELKEQYNRQSDQVPGFVGEIVGGERVNFKVEQDGTNRTVGVAFDGVEISKIKEGGLEDPTLKAWTDQETISAVIDSEDKYSTLQQKLEENEIRYEATTTGTTIKVVIFETLQNIAEFLGLEF